MNMKKNIILTKVAETTRKVATLGASPRCIFTYHQPKLPASVQAMSKKENKA